MRQTAGDRTPLPIIWICVILGTASAFLGCGSAQEQRQEPELTWHLKGEPESSTELAQIQTLVEQERMDDASIRLKRVRISDISSAEQPLFTYLNARVALASKPSVGCALISKFALNAANGPLRSSAIEAALGCLKAPQDCEKIVPLAEDALNTLSTHLKNGQLNQRLACKPIRPVLSALTVQRASLSQHNPSIREMVSKLLKNSTAEQLITMRKETMDTRWLSQLITETLLLHFSSELKESSQHEFIQSLPKENAIRSAWHQSTSSGRVLVCCPLSGQFESIGKGISTQIKGLANTDPQLFASKVSFLDCSDEAWSKSAYTLKVDAVKPHAILSLTSRSVHRDLEVLARDPNAPLHLTLNPFEQTEGEVPSMWRLSQSPELFVGTLIRNALQELNRAENNPIPLRVLLVTSPGSSPVRTYIRRFAQSFAGFKSLEIPQRCSGRSKTRTVECETASSQAWTRLAHAVVNDEDGLSPSDVLILDISPDRMVFALKYIAAERARRAQLSSGIGKKTPTTPLVYADEKALWAQEGDWIQSTDSDGTATRSKYRNRFVRLAGHYADNVRYLVHFNPLQQNAHKFAELAEQTLKEKPKQNLIILVEALKLIDQLAFKSRQELKSLQAIVKSGYDYVGHTSGLNFSVHNKTLPRLTILTTKDGYFVDAVEN